MRRDWRPEPVMGVPDRLILFDGVCVLCSGGVQFVINRDPAAHFRFTPVQSAYGTALAQRLGISVDNPETNAVVFDARAYFKSDAAIEVLSRLPGWSWTLVFARVPRPLRHWLYDLVARSRYNVFGRTDHCLIPTPDIRARFIVN